MKTTFVKHIDGYTYNQRINPVMDETDLVENLEQKLAHVVRAGNAIVRAQTQVEKNQAIHDWNELIKLIQK